MATKTVIYVGPFVDGVELEDGQWAEHGEPIDVDEDLAGHLLEQVDNFVLAGSPPPPPPDDPPPTADETGSEELANG